MPRPEGDGPDGQFEGFVFDQTYQRKYRDLFGAAGSEEFHDLVLPMSREILGGEPQKHAQTLDSLLTVAASHSRSSMLPAFWSREVSPATFEFQRDFDVLLATDERRLEPNVVHINDRRLLRETMREGQIVPKFMREGRPFDPQLDGETDDYRVSFVDGNVDKAARFLAGFGLVSQEQDHTLTNYTDINGPLFRRSQALAFADLRQGEFRPDPGGHVVLTTYASPGDERIQTYYSHTPVPIRLVDIPLTVLLPEQKKALRVEGGERFRANQFFDDNLHFDVGVPRLAADVFAYTRHRELAIKKALQDLISPPQQEGTGKATRLR